MQQIWGVLSYLLSLYIAFLHLSHPVSRKADGKYNSSTRLRAAEVLCDTREFIVAYFIYEVQDSKSMV